MKNVYQIRNEQGGYCVLPSDYAMQEIKNPNRVGIVVYLYYEEGMEAYLKYLKKLPQGVDVMLISSNENVLERMKQMVLPGINVQIVSKINRGRDVAAFLVTAKEYVQSHEYVAFLHDKKEKYQLYEEDIFLWAHSMWDNTVRCEEYISNVIHMFDCNRELGLALPVIDIGKYMMIGFQYPHVGWMENYKNTKRLSEELHLNCNLEKEFPPISYGTVFWCRTKALKKLLDKNWRYEDFQEEPMDDDGTISHAIERIFPYVAQDAGFKTCMIMNDVFASGYLGKLHATMDKLWSKAREIAGIYYPYQISNDEDRSRLKTFCQENSQIYIYGAGKIGGACYTYMRKIVGEPVTGFIDKNKHGQTKNGLPIVTLEEVQAMKDAGIIVAVGAALMGEVLEEFKELQIKKYITYLLDFSNTEPKDNAK